VDQKPAEEKPFLTITVGKYRVEAWTAKAAHDFIDEGNRRQGDRRSRSTEDLSEQINDVLLHAEASAPRVPMPAQKAMARPRLDPKADFGTHKQYFHEWIPSSKYCAEIAKRIASSADGVTGTELAAEFFNGVRNEVWRTLEVLKDKAKKCGFTDKEDVVKADPEGNTKRYRPGPALDGFMADKIR